jgi:predicted Rossmann fold nucleotide-binding protein DprA/Smf involved in DNA uptake
MPRNTQVLDEFRDRLRERRDELTEELREIEQLLGVGGKGGGRRRPGRPRGSGTKTATASSGASGGATSAPRRRRRRRKGTRADQAVQLVQSSPGISASEIAKQMKIKPNYLYRVLGELEKEGRVTKKGREYHATGK